MSKYCIVKTTFPSKKKAKDCAIMLLNNSLAACVQIKKIKSLYKWQGKIENQKEYLVEIKTKLKLYKDVEKFILQNHSYQTPQIVAVDIIKAYDKYLEWIDSETI